MLSILVALACSASPAAYEPRGCRNRSCFTRVGGRTGGSDSTGEAPFVLAQSVSFIASGVGTIPNIIGNATAVAVSMPARDGGSTYEWYDNTGTVMSGTTQGSGMLFGGNFAGGRALLDVTDARAPFTTNTALRNLATADWTVICAGYATQRASSTSQTWFDMWDTGSKEILGYSQSGAFRCSNDGASHFAASDTTYGQALDGESIVWCRQSGTSICAGAMNINSEQCTTHSTPGAMSAGHMVVGAFGSIAAGFATRGNHNWCAYFNADVGLPFIHRTILNWWGVAQPEAMLNKNNTPQLEGKDNTATTGFVDMFRPFAFVVDPLTGIRTQKGFSSPWAADPLDFSSMTTVGTATVVTDVASGPFSRRLNAAEVDRVNDADVLALAGVTSAEAVSICNNGWCNASCFLAQGSSCALGSTTTKATIHWNTNGTPDAGGDCQITGLTGTYGRYPTNTGCPIWIDNATSIKPQLLVGTVAAETGCVLAAQCQVTGSLNMKPPVIDNAAKGIGFVSFDGGTMTHGAVKGGIEVVVRLPIDSDQFATLGNAKSISSFLEDAFDSASPSHIVTHVYGDQGDTPAMLAILYGPSFGSENYLITALATPARTWFAVSLRWRPVGTQCLAQSYFNLCPDQAHPESCTATTLVNTGVPGECPNQADTVYVGNRYDNSDTGDVELAVINFYR